MVLVSGEAGIGESRLLQTFSDQLAEESCLRLEYRSSPYHQRTALYPTHGLAATHPAVAAR
jgi:predicted ATP-dependent serine protease